MLPEKRLLIIDDERRMADSLQSLFEAEGYRADVAYGGVEGIEKIRVNDYHVIITDIRMGDRDGYDVMRFVRDNRPKALVIAITGYVSTESVIQAIRQSAFDYVPKPYEFDMLRGVVERAFVQIETRQMREDLISMITHDIKVPLGTIIGYAHLALESGSDNLPAQTREFLELISINSQRILSLVDNFLTTCRVEAGRLEILEMPVNLLEVIEDLRPISDLEARKRDVELHVRIEPCETTVLGDANLLFRALGNLFHNAIKYAGHKGWVEIVMRNADLEREGQRVRCVLVEIANSGEGIAPEALPRIFERFERWGAARGSHEGAGLGLYVVRCIVESHHGFIDVESQPGERTVFRVYFPLAPADAVAAEPIAADQPE
ncbi:MAG: ATP-binding protein [Candidatus Sumerlaeia bacterium]|nr:ATP-binding protein [Candidatus Sumerlaeia bacterium]